MVVDSGGRRPDELLRRNPARGPAEIGRPSCERRSAVGVGQGVAGDGGRGRRRSGRTPPDASTSPPRAPAAWRSSSPTPPSSRRTAAPRSKMRLANPFCRFLELAGLAPEQPTSAWNRPRSFPTPGPARRAAPWRPPLTRTAPRSGQPRRLGSGGRTSADKVDLPADAPVGHSGRLCGRLHVRGGDRSGPAGGFRFPAGRAGAAPVASTASTALGAAQAARARCELAAQRPADLRVRRNGRPPCRQTSDLDCCRARLWDGAESSAPHPVRPSCATAQRVDRLPAGLTINRTTPPLHPSPVTACRHSLRLEPHAVSPSAWSKTHGHYPGRLAAACSRRSRGGEQLVPNLASIWAPNVIPLIRSKSVSN